MRNGKLRSDVTIIFEVNMTSHCFHGLLYIKEIQKLNDFVIDHYSFPRLFSAGYVAQ